MQKKLFNIQNVDIVTLVTEYLFNQFHTINIAEYKYVCQFSFKKF